jgi:hypothetical protein
MKPRIAVPEIIRAAGDDAVRAYREFLDDPARSPHTRRVYGVAVRRFLRWAEARGAALRSLTADDWIAFAAGLSPAVAANIRAPVAGLFAHLAAAGVLRSNPLARRLPGPRPDRDRDLRLAELKQAVRELDPTWEEDSEFFQAGLVVLAPAAIDTRDPAAISAYTGVPEPEVRAYADRLLANRKWRPDGTVNIDPDDPDGWGTTLIVHVLIALGLAEARPTERGDLIVPLGPDAGPDAAEEP